MNNGSSSSQSRWEVSHARNLRKKNIFSHINFSFFFLSSIVPVLTLQMPCKSLSYRLNHPLNWIIPLGSNSPLFCSPVSSENGSINCELSLFVLGNSTLHSGRRWKDMLAWKIVDPCEIQAFPDVIYYFVPQSFTCFDWQIFTYFPWRPSIVTSFMIVALRSLNIPLSARSTRGCHWGIGINDTKHRILSLPHKINKSSERRTIAHGGIEK